VTALLCKQAKMLAERDQGADLVVHFDPDPPNLPGVFTPANLEIGGCELRKGGSLLLGHVGEVDRGVAVLADAHVVRGVEQGDRSKVQ
jgi:hypothetical protein